MKHRLHTINIKEKERSCSQQKKKHQLKQKMLDNRFNAELSLRWKTEDCFVLTI